MNYFQLNQGYDEGTPNELRSTLEYTYKKMMSVYEEYMRHKETYTLVKNDRTLLRSFVGNSTF